MKNRSKVLKIVVSIIIVLLLLCIIGIMSSVSNNIDSKTNHTTENNVTETIIEITYFPTDELVNDFFKKYNAISNNPINVSDIKKGNIKTKALVYIDGFNMEVINSKQNFLSISIGSNPEDEYTTLYSVFKDCVKATKPNINDEEIEKAWNDIHTSGYLSNNDDLNGISITYIPYKELSEGHSNLRIDLEIST